MNLSLSVSGTRVTARVTGLLTGGGTGHFYFDAESGTGAADSTQRQVTVSNTSTSTSATYSGSYGWTVYVTFEIYYNSGEYDSASDSIYIDYPAPSASMTVTASGTTIIASVSDLDYSGGTAKFLFESENNAEIYNVPFTGTSVSYSYYHGVPNELVNVTCTITYNNGLTDTFTGSATTKQDTTAPPAPVFAAVPTTNTITITVTNNSSATQYTYFVRLATETEAMEATTNSKTYTFTGLLHETLYAVNVRAENQYGTTMGTTLYVTTLAAKPLYIYDGTKWANATPYIYNNGWLKVIPYFFINNEWNEGG